MKKVPHFFHGLLVLYIHKSILMYFAGISFSFLSPLDSVIQRVHSAGNMLSTEEKSNSKGKSGGHKLSALYEPLGGGEGERERERLYSTCACICELCTV